MSLTDPTILVPAITAIVVLVGNLANVWRDRRRDRHEAEIKSDLHDAQSALNEKLDENTAITRETGHKADAAYNEANNFNLKLPLIQEVHEHTRAIEKIQSDLVRIEHLLIRALGMED